MTGYYDYVLGLIPGTLAGITALLSVAGVDPLLALPVGAVAAALVVGHALFVNGPVVRDGDAVARSAADSQPVNAD